MNRVLTFAALALALLSLGCGGSSTGTSSTTSAVSTASYSLIQVEAVVLSASQSPPTSNWVVEDTENIQLGEEVEFQIVGYDSAGVRHVLSSSGWRTQDTTDEYGTVDPYSGVFTVGQVAMQSPLIVEALYNGKYYSAYYKVNPTQARVIGQLVSSNGRTGVPNVEIDFFSSGGQVVDIVHTSYDGTFRASMPTNAVSFTINPATVPTNYWQSFTYGLDSNSAAVIYDAGSATCNATIGNLYTRSGGLLGTTLTVGDNLMFAPTQPSTLLTPVTPASSTDPGVIVIASRTTYTSDPISDGCSL